MCCFYLRYIVLALRVSQGVSLSLFPPPVDQLVSNLRRRILVRRSDLQWPAQTESPSLGVCDSSLHGPTCSFFESSYVDVGFGELLPQTLLDSSDDPDELRSSVNRLLRHLNHTETVYRNAEAVHFVLSLQTSTFTHMPGEVGIHYSDKWSIEEGTRPVLIPSDAAGLITFTTKNVTITELVLESSSPVVVQGLSVGRVLWEGHARLSPLQSRIDMIAQSLLVGMTRSQLDVPADATAVDEIRIISVSPVTLFTIEGRISINNPWASGHRSLVLEPRSRSKYRRAWLGIIADSADFVDINYIADHGLRWKRAPSAREVDLTRGVYTNDLYSEIVTMARPTPGFFKLSQHVGRVVMSIWGKTHASNEDSIIEAALATTTQDTAIVEYLRWAALSGSNRSVVDDSELDSEELAVRKDMKEVLDMMHNRFHQKAIKKPKAKATVISVDLNGRELDSNTLSAAVQSALELATGSTGESAEDLNNQDLDEGSTSAETHYIFQSEKSEHVIDHEDLLDAVESLLERVRRNVGGDEGEEKTDSLEDPHAALHSDELPSSERQPTLVGRLEESHSSAESSGSTPERDHS